MNDKIYVVYILANKKNGTIYIGVTGDLKRRMIEHRNSLVEGFTQEYDVKKLVYITWVRELNFFEKYFP